MYLVALYNLRGFCYHAYKLDCSLHELVDRVCARSPVKAIAENDWFKQNHPEACYWEVEDKSAGTFCIFQIASDPDTTAPVWAPLVIKHVNRNTSAYAITHFYQEEDSQLELKWKGDQYYGVRDFHLREAECARYSFEFRLRDDDGEVYFYGRTNDTSSFAPLDDWGDHFGATSIEFLNNGVWEEL
jgi:hypothetical protein